MFGCEDTMLPAKTQDSIQAPVLGLYCSLKPPDKCHKSDAMRMRLRVSWARLDAKDFGADYEVRSFRRWDAPKLAFV